MQRGRVLVRLPLFEVLVDRTGLVAPGAGNYPRVLGVRVLADSGGASADPAHARVGHGVRDERPGALLVGEGVPVGDGEAEGARRASLPQAVGVGGRVARY